MKQHTPRGMARHVSPEKLDALPHDDPAAQRSRDELRLINALMGNYRWLGRTLAARMGRGQRVLELGAGDGELARRLWQSGVVAPEHWWALDLAPRPKNWSETAENGPQWLQRDVLGPEPLPEAEILVANLFLHHFQPDQLRELGTRLPASCRLIVACEPARQRRHLLLGRALSVVARLSDVTHHDMLVSIRAGFLVDDLATALGLVGWQWSVSLTVLGAYHFIARR